MSILALLQARTSSSRFPGKVLQPLLGRPMILRQMDRLRLSKKLGMVTVVTSTDASDDQLTMLCRNDNLPVFRGSLDDVLDRFYQAAIASYPDHIVRLTGDCPLCDPQVIDDVLQFYLDGGFDYASNTIHPTFPDGLDVEVFRSRVLREAWEEARLPSQREHVTPFIHQQPERYKLGDYRQSVDRSTMRWTVDTPEDYELITKIYECLYPKNAAFSSQDIYQLLEDPGLLAINSHRQRNEGYRQSLLKDLPFLQ
jgi:spore coat polysaccharide biosynthesis protein SpsF